MVLLDLMGVAFLEEAEICRSAQNRCASSWKDPCQPPEFLKSQTNSSSFTCRQDLQGPDEGMTR